MTFGFLNYDVWNWIVGYLVDDMRIVREFPSYPDVSNDIGKRRGYHSESHYNLCEPSNTISYGSGYLLDRILVIRSIG